MKDARRADLLSDLDRGEAEVLALAQELDARLVIIDERLGRRHARRLGFTLTGTLGVLLRAKAAGGLPAVRPVIERIRAGGIWLKEVMGPWEDEREPEAILAEIRSELPETAKNPGVNAMNRDTAWGIVTEHVQDEGLRRHMLAVEAAMRWYAGKLGEDPETWGLAGLLHDFDWEVHPTLEGHPKEGAPILRERGVPETVVQAILSHNTAGSGVARARPIDYALLACDEITGLIIAAALVRPHKDVRQLSVKSIKRNWKDKLFAAGVDREEVREAVEDLSRECYGGGLELWQHTGNVLEAMSGEAERLGLDGRLAAGL